MWWPNDVEMALSLLEACSGIGMILGPIVGSAVYTILGFRMSFFALGGMLVPVAFLTYCFFIRRLKRQDGDFVAADEAAVADSEKAATVETGEIQQEPVGESQVSN